MARTQNGNFIAESGQNYTFGDSTTQSSAAYTKSESDALYLGITDTAADSSKLNNQSASYYLNATNINSGTLSAARLPDTYIPTSQKGAASGVCPLDGSGLVDSSYLPSYVDDVEEYADYASLPGTGETGKIYTTLDTNLIYRWSGSAYVQINSSISEADTLDGLHAASFLRSDQSDTMVGSLSIQAASQQIKLFESGYGDANDFYALSHDENAFKLQWYDASVPNTATRFSITNAGNIACDGTLTVAGASGTIDGNTIYHAGNLTVSSFLRSDEDDTASGKITHTDNIIIQTNNGTAAKEILFDNKTTGIYDFGLYVPNDNSGFTIHAYKTNNKLVFNEDGDTLTVAGNTIYHAGNLTASIINALEVDAGTLDDHDSTYFATDSLTCHLAGSETITGQKSILDTLLSFNDSDVGHGMTSVMNSTSAYGQFNIAHGTSGGLTIKGASDANYAGLEMAGIIGTDDPSDTMGAIRLYGSKKNGTSNQALGSSETVMQILNYSTAVMTITGDGTLYQGTSNEIYHAGNLAFGSGSGDMCEGNDSRLSDARTPVSHNNTYHSETYITSAGVTYENLSTNSDVGTGSDQVAAGNHTHSGTYEPADATILKQADVDDTPIDAATTVPISSNWAYDHAARFKAGVKSISDASNTVTVDFTTEGLTDYAGTDYSINPVIENTTDGTPGGYNLDITAKSATGFTIKLSGLTDSANYKLDWFTYYYG